MLCKVSGRVRKHTWSLLELELKVSPTRWVVDFSL